MLVQTLFKQYIATSAMVRGGRPAVENVSPSRFKKIYLNMIMILKGVLSNC